jgi:DNA-directed RNA polymerase II subunit RPB1
MSSLESGKELQGFNRRFAHISIPGITEPKIVQDVNPTITPGNTSRTAQGRPIVQDRKQQQRLRARARAREQMLIMSEIDAVEFNLFSTEEIDNYAVVNVTSPDKEGSGTVRDLKMGPHSENVPCDTCSSDIRGCPGHYGKIILPKLMHPLTISTIILVLSCVCNTCGRLLVNQNEIERAGIKRMSGVKRLQAIKDLVSKLKRNCERYANVTGVQRCDPNPIYSSLRENKDDYRLAYTYPGPQNQKKTPFFLPPDIPDNMPGKSIYKILHSIPSEDAELLGFNESHPRDMIMERLVVIPYCARPDLFQGDAYYPDDLTTMYIDIVKSVLAFTNPNNTEADKDIHLKSIYFKVSHLMKNDGRYNQGGVKIYTDVKKRVQGKTAIVRANIMGKRVNFAGRTVVGPGHYLRVDEVGIPRLMAARLTRPIKVTDFNREELQNEYNSGRVKHITMRDGPLAGARVMVSESFKQRFPDYQLQYGDIVERMLEDGDIVLINRQPTLHKQNILAVYARIIDDRIVRINLSVTTPLNADFDGDEINIHVPQTIEAYAEAEQLLGIYRNLMSSQTNKPMMGIVYDTLSGAYLLTYSQEEYERLGREIIALTEKHQKLPEKIEQLKVEIASVEPNNKCYEKLSKEIETLSKELLEIPELITCHEVRRMVVGTRLLIDPIVFDLAIKNVEDAPQYATLYQRLDAHGINHRSGRALISSVFPADFDYNANGVVIKNGILTNGVLTKDTLGNKDGSIIAEMVKQQGGFITVDFMSDIQFVVRDFLMQHGLSVGIEDCIPGEAQFRNNIDQIITYATLKVIALSGKPTNKVMAEQQERKICEALDIAKNEGDKIVQKYFHPDNVILIMANSGAKGTVFNAIQMSSALGQQKVSGKRIQTNLAGERALPCIDPKSKDPKDRGYVTNSFGSGLEPKEFFFHAQGGREGLTDTAVNTAQTGFLQHQIIKSAEDIHISPDYSVRSADAAIVQFVYGDDGMDASELGTIKIRGENVPFFRNLNQLADKINRRYAPRSAF